jgi:regulator of protease activity HflC (stomatin/prohibitin superfamily)
MDLLAVIAGLSVFLLFTLSRCWFRVDEGSTVVLTSFGAALRDGKHLRTFPPGLHFKAPWQHAHHVSTKEQSLLLSGEEGGRTAMAEDGTVLRFDSILRYAPAKDELEAYLFGLKRRREHIVGLFTCLLRSEIANFRAPDPEGGPVTRALASRSDGGSFALIRRERQLLNKRIESFVMDAIGANYGVHFSAVDLTDILPPDELADALNAVLTAHANADSLYARAESDCQQRMLAAERGVEIARERARAAELEIVTLGSYLAKLETSGVLDAYVARRRAEVLSEAKGVYLKGRA